MDPEEQKRIEQLEKLYKNLPGGYNADSVQMGRAFTYGELTMLGTQKLIHEAECLAGNIECFVDLGSGTGKSVLLALLLLPELKRSVGVELSPQRHATAMRAAAEMERQGLDPTVHERAVFLNEDARLAVATVAAADVIWISNQCFPPELNHRIAKLIDAFAPVGSIVCSTVQLDCRRVSSWQWRGIQLPATWSPTHTANIAQITEEVSHGVCTKMPISFSDHCSGGGSMTSAFLFWIRYQQQTSSEENRKGLQNSSAGDDHLCNDEEDSEVEEVLPTRLLRPAICTVFLHGEHLEPEELLAAMAPGAVMDKVVTEAEKEYEEEDGFDLEEFKTVCENASWATGGWRSVSMSHLISMLLQCQA